MPHPIANAEQDPIAGWLARQYEHGEPLPEMISLFHVNGADNNVQLERMQIAVHTAESATRMAASLRFRARQDAETKGGHERYSVALEWADDAEREPMFFSFTVDGMQVRTSQLDTPTEPASLQGVTKMLMRHNEVFMKVAMGQSAQHLEQAHRREEMLLSRLESMERDRMRVVELQEELMSRQLERDQLRIRAENTERRKDEALQEAIPLFKAMAPKLLEAAAGAGGGEQSAATVAAMRMLCERVSIDQLKAMAGQLEPDQQMVFLDVFRKVMDMPAQSTPTADADAEVTPEPADESNDEPTH